MPKRLSMTDVLTEIEDRSILCLDDTYVNNKYSMLWECCVCNYQWKNSFDHIKNKKQGCPRCAGNLKYTIDDAYLVAKKKGGRCLSTTYQNTHKKLKWQCEIGHVWSASLHKVMYETWCPDCGGSKKKTIEDCKKLAKERNINGDCLSSIYINANSLLSWDCGSGHTWETSYVSVYSGSWCPYCQLGKKQKQLLDIVKQIFPEHEVLNNYRKLSFLRNPETNYNLEIDIWIPVLKLAIEYDGEQHFRPVRFNGISEETANNLFVGVMKRDKLKNKLIAQSELVSFLIRFKYDEELSYDLVLKKLTKSGVIQNGNAQTIK